MQISQLELPKRFNRLDMNPYTIPTRSCLYQLEPRAVGTAYIESITSYTKRLAEAHSVTVSHLIRRKLSLLEQADIATQALHWLGKRSAALVGTTTSAFDLVQVLEIATSIEDLQLLTILPWKGVFPAKGLTHSAQVWCPLCFEEWKEKGEIIYEPLIWAFKAITLCPIHYYPLQKCCPHCHKPNYPLDYQARLGHCSKCEKWLGQRLRTRLSLDSFLEEKERDWVLWVCDNISDLIRNVDQLSLPLPSGQVGEAFNAYVHQRASGSVAAFARYLRMNQPTVQSWCSGRILPQVEVLLKVCKRLDVKLSYFLTANLQSVNTNSNNFSPYNQTPHARRPFKTPRVDLENARQILENALENEYPPPSVKEVIGRVRCCNATLHKYFSDLCRAIAQRHLDYKRSERVEALRQLLNQAIASNEAPPLSLQEVAEQVGIPPAMFYRYVPELCSAISERYLNFCRERGISVIEEACERVRQAVFNLHNQGLYPSSSRIMYELNDRHIFRQEEAKEIWYKTLQELGIKA